LHDELDFTLRINIGGVQGQVAQIANKRKLNFQLFTVESQMILLKHAQQFRVGLIVKQKQLQQLRCGLLRTGQ
jgi:hypothetical protein